MFVFAQQMDPRVMVEVAIFGPVYLFAFVLAVLLVDLFRKDMAMRAENKLYRDEAKEQRMSFMASVDKVIDKV